MKKPQCHNCKYASEQFKLSKTTHIQCQNEKYIAANEANEPPWGTLQEFWNSCEFHEYKQPEIQNANN